MSTWKNLGISKKLAVGFGLTILVLAAAVWGYHRTVRLSLDAFGALLETELAAEVGSHELESRMLQCRRNEKDFLLRKDKQYVASFNKAVDEVDLQIDRVARLVRRAGNAELAAKLQNCRGDAGKYRDIFHAVAAGWEKMGLDCNSGLQGEFRNAVHQLESLADTAELRVLVLMVRRHEKDFLLRGDEKYVKATHDALAALGKAIANRKLPEPRAKIAGQLVQAYGQSFDGLVAADRSIALVTETMRQTVHQLEPVIEALGGVGQGSRRSSPRGGARRSPPARQIAPCTWRSGRCWPASPWPWPSPIPLPDRLPKPLPSPRP